MHPIRKPLRLKCWDYSQTGTYFLTVCTKDRRPLLCRIEGFDATGYPKRTMTPVGLSVETFVREITHHHLSVTVDHFVIMPNHIHLLLTICNANGAPGSSRPTELVPRIIGLMKRMTSPAGASIWQTGYMDHVIRNEADYQQHWTYIENNPFRWAEDQYYI